MTQEPTDPRWFRSRQALIAAMTHLLDERDLAEISVTDLVQKASVSRPTFYQHFDDMNALARLTSLLRFEADFPARPFEDTPIPLEERVLLVEQRWINILRHMHQHSAFYRRIYKSAGYPGPYADLVHLLESRVLSSSPLAPTLRQSGDIPLPDRVAMISGGVSWMILNWLFSDFTGDNDIPVAARRIALAMAAFA